MKKVLILMAAAAYVAGASAVWAGRGGEPDSNSDGAASDSNAHDGNGNADGGRSGGDPQGDRGNDSHSYTCDS